MKSKDPDILLLDAGIAGLGSVLQDVSDHLLGVSARLEALRIVLEPATLKRARARFWRERRQKKPH